MMTFDCLQKCDDAGALYDRIRLSLKESGIIYSDTEAKEILAQRLRLNLSDIVLKTALNNKRNDLLPIIGDIEKRLEGWTLDRIYGEKDFYNSTFFVNEFVLTPRPDTEILIEEALKLPPPESILDLGTGSGCIVLTLLQKWKNAYGVGVDYSHEALKIAKRNSGNLNLNDRAHWICGDWAGAIGRTFDLIVSNPPYIRNNDIKDLSKDVTENDPILALDGGVDGLQAYKAILLQLSSLLSQNGTALFEIGWDQEEAVMRLIENEGFFVSKVVCDYAGHPRVIGVSKDSQWG